MSKTDYIKENDYLVMWKQSRGEWIPNFVEGKIYSTNIDRYLKPKLSNRGYYVLDVRRGSSVRTSIPVHRALWIMRYGIPQNPRLEVDHINNNPLDNRLCNLRLVTSSENHRNKPEMFARAERIRAEKAAGAKTSELAEKYGYSLRMIQYIISNNYYDPAKYPGTEKKKHLHYSNPLYGEDMLRWKP